MQIKNLLLILALSLGVLASACATDDIEPGNKGFMFDGTGSLALYSGGSGLLTDNLLNAGTHYTGLYDEVKDVDCKDAHARESIAVLTKSDLTVEVDLRITYAAECGSSESVQAILNQVAPEDGRTVLPKELYIRYVLPIVRESLRNQLAAVTIEEVKSVREALRDGVEKDLTISIKAKNSPVVIRILSVSDIRLPKQIIAKNQLIELARQDAEQEREKQEAAKYRLERELFEAQEDRKVQVENAEKAREVAKVNAERDKEVTILQAEALLERKKKEAEGIAAIRGELTGSYLAYLKLLKDAEVKNNIAAAMANGTKWYVGPDFLIPPGSPARVALSR